MKKANHAKAQDVEMRENYDIPWAKAVRGKYAARFKKGCYFVPIDPDLKQSFPTADAINKALHSLAEIAQRETKIKPRRKSA